MWRKKKVLFIALLAVLVLAGTIGGAIIVQAADSTTTGNVTQPKTVMSRVAEILGIDQQKLESAFTQAQNEAQVDALKERLQALVTAGKITQAQADEYIKWWQSKPDMAPFQQQMRNWMQSKPGLPSDAKEWQQSKPNVPLTGGLGNRGMRNGGRMGGMGGLNLPGTAAQ